MKTKRIVIELGTNMDDEAFDELAHQAIRQLTEGLGHVAYNQGRDLVVYKTHVATVFSPCPPADRP